MPMTPEQIQAVLAKRKARLAAEKESEEEEEVRCVCPDCFAEGKCMVSKRRAKELETQEQMEECCPWGDQCTADMQPSDEEPACEECGAERPPKFMHYCGTCNAYACDDCLEYKKKKKKWYCHPNLKFTDCAKNNA